MKFIFNTVFIGYIVLIFISNLACSDETGTPIKDKKSLIAQLQTNYDAELLSDSSAEFTQNYTDEILKKPVILDSLVSEVRKESDGNYVYAKVKSDSACTILARLKCSDNLFEKLSGSQSTNILFTANISRINLSEGFYEAQTIERDTSVFTRGKEIYIEGDCLAANELVAF